MIKVVSFDVGHTLIRYNNQLNWSALYRPALEAAAESCGFSLTDKMLASAVSVLSFYNTRIYPRENEVNSEVIFGEMFRLWGYPASNIALFKFSFFSFFITGAQPYPEVVGTLDELKRAGLKLGILTDVAYGMENELSMKDITPLADFIDISLSSVDVGYRKPNPTGFLKLLELFEILPCEMIYVGDEEKDIIGARNVGIIPVLINRSKIEKNFKQAFTIKSLYDIKEVIKAVAN